MSDIELTKLRSGNSRLQQQINDVTRKYNKLRKEVKRLRKENRDLKEEMARQKRLLKPRGR